jgi:hypothetical protein
MTYRSRRLAFVAATCAAILLASGALAATEPAPAVSPDGLQLVKQTPERLVYVKPGASFAKYQRVAILECYVEFQKGWQQNYNLSAPTLDARVTDADVQRMKTAIATEFKRVFTEELQKNGGYEVVDVAAPDVLLLRPALLNVVVTAPDIQTAGMEATIVRSAGHATLYLELWDSATKTLLARVMDAKAATEPVAEVANRVTNTAAADDVLRSWADNLRRHLDAVRAKPQGQ